ncbi:hypothetical protein DEO72_LG11g1361 [Vigna unguiculata]|uniref:Uncharacterized protein n=1 Tax=Vigna unguiculata TaxID=3917 RepID=A0A4D6NN47_VIGUN|nr:hypothetical protein DEO72_LG11g1361 [Vigna unguiculata]
MAATITSGHRCTRWKAVAHRALVENPSSLVHWWSATSSSSPRVLQPPPSFSRLKHHPFARICHTPREKCSHHHHAYAGTSPLSCSRSSNMPLPGRRRGASRPRAA